MESGQVYVRRHWNTVRAAGRVLLGAALVNAGVSHLTYARHDFLAQVPPWLPMAPDLVVVLSGVFEILLGTALLFLPRQKFPLGWIAAAFFVCIFPGNLAQFTHHRNAFNLNTDQARLIRLFFQPVLVAWALWSTSAWRDFRQMRNPQ